MLTHHPLARENHDADALARRDSGVSSAACKSAVTTGSLWWDVHEGGQGDDRLVFEVLEAGVGSSPSRGVNAVHANGAYLHDNATMSGTRSPCTEAPVAALASVRGGGFS